MKRVTSILLATLLLCLFAGSLWAANFEADMVMTGPMGDMTGKIYVEGERQRQDMEGPMGRTTVITLGEDQSSLIVMHDRQAYMEMAADNFPMASDMGAVDPTMVEGEKEAPDGMKMQNLGNETINGYVCEKLRLVSEEEPGVSTLIWFSHDLGVPLRAIHETPEGTSTVEYKNIVEGKVSEKTFAVPEGYQKMDLGGF